MIYDRSRHQRLIFGYVLFFFAATFLTLLSSPQGFAKPITYQVGQILGSLSLTALALQLLLSSRANFLERRVGLDRIMRLHAFNGKLLVLTVLLHPTLLLWPQIVASSSFLTIFETYTVYHWLGTLAVAIIVFTVLVTVFSRTIRLNYEHWKWLHKGTYVAVVLGFFHSYFLGSDVTPPSLLFYWWIFLVLVVGWAILYRYGVRWYRLRDRWYTVVRVTQETADVVTITLSPKKGRVFAYFPGQFAFVRFISKHISAEEHHFTLSSSPSETNFLSFTVKASGDFTQTLAKLTRGDLARVEGPYGAFSYLGTTGGMVFIAGGIGITPFMSMLRHMRETKAPRLVVLLYSVKSPQEIVFRQELATLTRRRWFRLIYLFSQRGGTVKGAVSYQSRITLDILRAETSSLTTPTFFVAGPDLMMATVAGFLSQLGVSRKQILLERFALR